MHTKEKKQLLSLVIRISHRTDVSFFLFRGECFTTGDDHDAKDDEEDGETAYSRKKSYFRNPFVLWS